MLKETGIIMSGSHPRDILDGRKTMTRRTWGLEEVNKDPDNWFPGVLRTDGRWSFISKDLKTELVIKCPYGQVGDLLYIKETWAICSFSANFAKENQLQVAYRAGEPRINPHPESMTHSLEWRTVDYETWQKYACQKYHSWQPSLFMPKAFARIWLPITDLRAERLQKITDIDARREGIPNSAYAINGITSFKKLWDSLNAKRGYGWDKNKWVWPITFHKVKEVCHGQRPV